MISNFFVRSVVAPLLLVVCSFAMAESDANPTVTTAQKPKSLFTSYHDDYCMKYEQIERNELNQMIRDLKDTPYPTDDYFLIAGCKPQMVGGVKVPMLHLTAEDPCSRVEYPQIIHKYFTVKRKEPKLWLEVVNAKNTKGETFLDYIEHLKRERILNSDESLECADQLIEFACKTGGVYAKFDKTCPTGL